MNARLRHLASFAAALLLTASPALRAADRSVSFNGPNQYISVPNFHTEGVYGAVTVEFWARADRLAQQAAFMLSPDQAANRFMASISYQSGGNTNTYWDCGNIGGAGRLSIANPPGTVGNWTHYAFVSVGGTGQNMKIYVNGEEAGSKSGAGLFNPAGNNPAGYALLIGGDAGYRFAGRLDEFRVWNVVRSQAQIRANLHTPLTGSEPGLRLYYKFDEDFGITAVNSATATGSAFDGTLLNGVTRTAPRRVTVTSTADAGPGSLRQAIADYAAHIDFAPALSGQTIILETEIVIPGTSAAITVDAGSLPRGLVLDGVANTGPNRLLTVAAGQSLTLNGLTLTGGNGGGATGDGSGGAILNAGMLTLHRCTLYNNKTGLAGDGGAIATIGPLKATQCTFHLNRASDSGGAIRGGVGSVELVHCTVAGNSCLTGDGGGVSGTLSTLQITHSILTANTLGATGAGRDVFANAGTVLWTGGNFVSQFVNLGATVTGPAPSTASPQIALFGDYGGPARTMPPLPGSPAINAATGSTITTDQRGFPVSDTPDSGAVEAGVLAVTTTTDELTEPFTAGDGISLREAILVGAADRVVFANALDGATITLAASLGAIPLASGITVDASGLNEGITLDGGPGANRIFHLTTTAPVTLTGLTLTGGEAPGARGGAILTDAGTALTLRRCTLTGNTALEGGAVFSLGRLTLERCTFTGNTGGYGGALQCQGRTDITHCTIAGNHGSTAGGGIFNKNTTELAPLTVAHSIVANNTSPLADGKDIFNQLADLIYDGVNNVRSDFNDRSVIGGINGAVLYRDDPLLAPLGDYGGPTRSMILSPGSPARNLAAGSTASPLDQRGYPMVGVPDLGACEAGNINSYATWSWDMTGANPNPNGDPDKDGITNFYEYATLTDPLVRNNRIEPGVDRHAYQENLEAKSYLEITLKVRRNQENLRYTIQRSSALSGWTTDATYDSANDMSVNAVVGDGDILTLRRFITGEVGYYYRVKFDIPQ